MRRTVALLGHNKCATSYLRDVIKSHPDITIIHHDEIERSTAEQLKERITAAKERVYIGHPFAIQRKDAMEKMFRACPDGMRGLIIYRHPVDIAVSMHTYMRRAMKRGMVQQVGG